MSSIIEDKGEKHIDQPEGLFNTSRKFSRRSFLKGGAIGAAGVALESLGLGCLREGSSMDRPLPGKPEPIRAGIGGGNSNTETRPVSIIEKVSEQLESSYQKIKTISQLWNSWDNKDVSSFPPPALIEISNQIEKYRKQIQEMSEVSEDQAKIINIYSYLNNAPLKDKKIGEIKFNINLEAKNSQFIIEQIEELFSYLPIPEGIVEVIDIEPRNIFIERKGLAIADAACETSKNQGAKLLFPDSPLDEEGWSRKKLFQRVIHELAHAFSLYRDGYNLQFLSPLEIINLVWEDTIIADQEDKINYRQSDRDEANAYLVADLLGNTNTLSGVLLKYPEIRQARSEFVNHWFSTLLRANIDIVKIGEQLNIR